MKQKNMMFIRTVLSLLLGSIASVSSVFAQQAPTPDQTVTALEKLSGVTPGERRNHIVGICVTGTFVGSKEAQAFSKSALFSGASIPVVGRFSLAGGNPNAPDAAKSPRGMALQFKLPENKVHHFTMLNIPVFSASNPKTFYDAAVANTPDPATGKPDPEKQKEFRATHPDSAPLGEFMSKNNPPASYANSDFFSIHTFKFLDAKNKTTLVKWQFVPEAGVTRLTDEQMTTSPKRFLDQDLIERVAKGPVRWNMQLTIGQAGDEENNPTVYWPADRQKISAGVLTITAATPQKGSDCEKINFDPLVMSDGIAPTNDPILMFRSPAYATSYAKRITGQ